MKKNLTKKYPTRCERGSLALEHVLFIGAIVAMSVGLFVFYQNISTYFSSIGFAGNIQGIGGTSSPTIGAGS